jgi:hypothetical protein
MAMRKRELVYRDGKPAAVILDIAEYEELLERAEDLDDLRALRRIRERPLRFRTLADVLTACPQDDTGSFVARDARPSGKLRGILRLPTADLPSPPANRSEPGCV